MRSPYRLPPPDSLLLDLASSPWTPVFIEGRDARAFARRLHAATYSGQGAPLVEVDCTWLPGETAGSLLFGLESPGDRARPGFVERANGGTLFLEDVAELPLLEQARLSKLLDRMSFRRIGGRVDVEVSLRIVASVRTSVARALAKGQLRRDLHARLNVFPIVVPSGERV